jgi:hypothetical protein
MEYKMDQECSTRGEMRNSHKIVERNPEGKRPILGPLDIDRTTMLKLVVQNREQGCNPDSKSSGRDPLASSHEDTNELLGYIKGEKFFVSLASVIFSRRAPFPRVN